MRLRRICTIASLAGLLALATSLGATGAGAVARPAPPERVTALHVLARWDMNEGPHAKTMTDSSGHGVTGSIGSAVQTGVTWGGARAFRWSTVDPTAPPAKPQRVIQVHNSALNPWLRDFAVALRYRTTHAYGNVLQKGQSGTPGGYFKFQQPRGLMTCLFRGLVGGRLVNAAVHSPHPLNDGRWHVVRCERSAAKVTMTVDGKLVATSPHATGSIGNTFPLTIGGKIKCNQVDVTCDYFSGDIDYVLIQAG